MRQERDESSKSGERQPRYCCTGIGKILKNKRGRYVGMRLGGKSRGRRETTYRKVE